MSVIRPQRWREQHQATPAEPPRIEGWFDGEFWHRDPSPRSMRAIIAVWIVGSVAVAAGILGVIRWFVK